MLITVGNDTYVTTQEADDYFAARYGFDSWISLVAADKEKALVSAAQVLDLGCIWNGAKEVANQHLAFPRIPDASPVPQAVKDAQCEIAFNIVAAGSATSSGDDPLSLLKAGSVTLEFKAGSKSNPIINSTITGLLSPYGLCSGSGTTKLIPIGVQ